MEISFDNPETRDLLCCQQNMVARFGNQLARLICCRLAVLRAAPSLAHIPAAPPISLVVSAKDGLCSVARGRLARLDFRPYAAKRVLAKNLAAISEIEIVGVGLIADAKGKKS